MKRLATRVTAVIAGSKTVLNEPDAAFVDVHLAAGDAGLGEADEARLSLALSAHHEGAAVDACKPVPVLAEPGMAIRGGGGRQTERGATVGRGGKHFLAHRLFAEEREGELIPGIEKRNRHLALP